MSRSLMDAYFAAVDEVMKQADGEIELIKKPKMEIVEPEQIGMFIFCEYECLLIF